MAFDLTIDVATPDDAASVTAVLEAAYPKLMRPAYETAILQRALPAMVRANPKLLGSGSYYVARQASGAIVACGGWTRERPGTGDIEMKLGHIRHFAVHPHWSGRGIGRRIYDACVAQARSGGVTIFEVFASLNAVPFYASLGFDRLDDIDVAMGAGVKFPSVWMRCRIDTTPKVPA